MTNDHINGSPLLIQLAAAPHKRPPFFRWLRAFIRTYWALWREFRGVILYFALVTVGGGILYGELHQAAYPMEQVALVDRPYIMLQMMILDSPALTIPREAHLILFWYMMPLFLVYIAARGAADFVRLFFSPDERQDAWMEAIASTYRNHVIVFGAGHVGLRVIVELKQMGYDVVVIDNDPDEGVKEALESLNAPLIVADGRTSDALEKAGLLYADAFVACTGSDHTNYEAVMKARYLNSDIRLVIRVWDDQFLDLIKNSGCISGQTALSSSDLSAPAFAAAALGIELTQTIKVGDVAYSTIHIKVAPGSFMDGADVGTLQRTEGIDIVLYSQNEKVEVQPKHDLIVRAGDSLVIFAEHSVILSLVKRNRPPKRARR